jgi:hypothetical protein
MKKVEVVKGERKLEAGEWRQRSTKVGTARLLVFEDGRFVYHDEGDTPQNRTPGQIKRFMNPTGKTGFVRIAPPPRPYLGKKP